MLRRGLSKLVDRAARAVRLGDVAPDEAILGVLLVLEDPGRMRTVRNAPQRTRLRRGD
ncbi:MAG: hypothetical protein M3229_00575 [Actinomycetota bacterium]|nr:hypothetical protein [Actinomycetota bacterium]